MSERLTAGDICTREVAIAFRHTDLVTAAKLMREYHVGALVVVDETQGLRTVAGLLTDRDIVISVVAPELVPENLNVGDVMSAKPVTAAEDASVIDVLRSMRAHGVRRIPVVGAQQLLIGLVTLDDILEVLVQELDLLAATIGRGIERERMQRA
ncbi:CBS domain-containing protein [Comamonas endophytica]|uniref:CBS domain-containing protein n=1 Tax=Comamonas endophytica TaxID=2949090 RepID=A0ABY6GAZ2_9BURK|nr:MULTISPECIES: CBS domain-containing protein [unclassified Acidovorax]MCD2513907.1 CBS domain-containing protein [Acidovorax sp. D4N7]UYG52098.1 CBS domain-containing protein [Acidovorax sp. 5MLIR]